MFRTRPTDHIQRSVAGGEPRAHHELHLVEYHEWQHQQPERTRTENNDRHRKARRQRLLRPAELNCDAVRPVELQPRRQPVGQPQHQGHHQNCHHDQQYDLPPGNASPNPLHYGG